MLKDQQKLFLNLENFVFDVVLLVESSIASYFGQIIQQMKRSISFDSEQQDNHFESSHFKKVDLIGDISHSHGQESEFLDNDSQFLQRHPHFSRKTGSNVENQSMIKSKGIRKNSQSAKMSRQRRKQYVSTLEKVADQLTRDITTRKQNLHRINKTILTAFMNFIHKYRYLIKKLEISKKMLAISAAHQQLKNNGYETSTPNTGSLDVIKQHQIVQGQQQSKANELVRKRMKKQEKKRLVQQEQTHKKIKDLQTAIQLGINAYMYQFGTKGCIRWDVIQRSKLEWVIMLQQSGIKNIQMLMQHLYEMKNSFTMLEEKMKKLDFYLRELKERVKDKFVIEVLLDREFFIENNQGTIYKNTKFIENEKIVIENHFRSLV